MKQKEFPKCNDSRSCYFRQLGRCKILISTYEEDGACGFCKENWEDPSAGVLEMRQKRREEKSQMFWKWWLHHMF